jgi:hypothetical protein
MLHPWDQVTAKGTMVITQAMLKITGIALLSLLLISCSRSTAQISAVDVNIERQDFALNSDQFPEYGDIRRAGHDGGDFFIVRNYRVGASAIEAHFSNEKKPDRRGIIDS